MSQFNKPIVSPFSPVPDNDEQFFNDLDKLRRKYNVRQIFVAYSRKYNKDQDTWYARSNVMSEGMLTYIQECLEDIEEILDDDENQPREDDVL